MDRVLKGFPEVERVFGKAGRFETPTDPAPLGMFETRRRSSRARVAAGMTGTRWSASSTRALQFPGMPNVWWMPIQTRTEMLATGVRSPLGDPGVGADIEGDRPRSARQIERALREVPGTRSAFAERIGGGYYLDFDVDRDAGRALRAQRRRRRGRGRDRHRRR